MFIHGGRGGAYTDKGKAQFPDYMFAHFLSNGYAVLKIDYRRFHFGDEELEDAVAGYRYLKSRPEIDSDRIAVGGESHGGYLALMLATKEKPAAVISYAGLVDVVGIFYERAKAFLPEVKENFEWREKWFHNGHLIRKESELIELNQLVPPERESIGDEVAKDLAFRWGDNLKAYQAYSPKEQYRLIESPLLFVVGSEDGFKVEGEKLVNALKQEGKVAIYSEHPGGGHGVHHGGEKEDDGNIHPEFYRSLEVSTRFLHEHLK
jgi:dipeptidyl aminopeptidase/acylaminoacyl peptidase